MSGLHTVVGYEPTECDIIGIDVDGCLLHWAPEGIYNGGETPEQFGIGTIMPDEWFSIAGSMEA